MIKNIFLLKILYPEHSYRLVVLAPRLLAITQPPSIIHFDIPVFKFL